MTIYPVKTVLGKLFEELLADHPRTIWGACPVSFSEYQGVYKYAVVFLFPFLYPMNAKNYSEQNIFQTINDTREDMHIVTDRIKRALDECGIEYLEPECPSKEVDAGAISISSKYIAVRAGLGWIGRNDLLIMPQYGPRLYTFTLMLNEEIDIGTPVTESKCGECDICVKKCTFRAIHGGILWKDDGSVTRDDLIDFAKCRDGRENLRKKMGRRMSCARCIAFCPYGESLP